MLYPPFTLFLSVIQQEVHSRRIPAAGIRSFVLKSMTPFFIMLEKFLSLGFHEVKSVKEWHTFTMNETIYEFLPERGSGKCIHLQVVLLGSRGPAALASPASLVRLRGLPALFLGLTDCRTL